MIGLRSCRKGIVKKAKPNDGPPAHPPVSGGSALAPGWVPYYAHPLRTPDRPFDWDPPRLAALARLNRAQGADVLRATLGRDGRHAVQATRYVGVVRLGRETVQILPKIYKHEQCGAEEAARNLLHLLAVAADLPVREHALAPQSAGTPRHLARREGRAVFHLKHDLALRAGDGTFPLLLDTKYKALTPAERGAVGTSPADMYQMHAYARRYACPRVLLLYPQTAGMTTPFRLHFDLEGGGMVQAATLDLRVDLGGAKGVRHLAEELKMILEEIV